MDDCCGGTGYVRALAPALAPGRLRETTLEVEGATCGACVARIEGALAAVAGVGAATFNLAARRARVQHAEAVTSEHLRAAIASAGYRAFLPGTAAADPRRERRTALWRTGLAGLAMMQVMMLAYPAYVADEGTLAWDQERLLAWASFLLTVPVLAFSAAPIWRNALRAARAGHATMDVPVALGLLAALAASIPATFTGGAVYYDSITMFVFFLSAARYVETRVLAATVAASESLAQLLPARAVRVRDGGVRETVDPASLRPGDHAWIAAGEAAPADGVLLEGATDFNEALLTGESAPAAKVTGDVLLAGSMNLTAPVTMRVERTGETQTLAQVRRLVEQAAASKPHWAVLADRWAGRFTVAIVLLAFGAALAWSFVEPAQALPVAMAVLVASCPCALSLAAPAAITACANALARRGVLACDGRAVEALAGVTHVVLDKTGTLTTGRLRIEGIDALGDESPQHCRALAAALAHAMPHPVAHALVASGASPLIARELRAVPGAGVEGVIRGVRHRVGSVAFCEEIAGRAPPQAAAPSEGPQAMLARDGEWLAAFGFEDSLRPDAREAIARLRDLGCEATLLSGDRVASVNAAAREAGIGHAIGEARPQDKLRELERLRASGAIVAMVGDGVNDAPSMAAASVGIAMGNGAALARSQAGLVLVGPRLAAIPEAIAVARKARRVIAQNLAWSAGYNAVAIPLAAMGVLAPWMASLGMSLSSLVVVLNAWRIARD